MAELTEILEQLAKSVIQLDIRLSQVEDHIKVKKDELTSTTKVIDFLDDLINNRAMYAGFPGNMTTTDFQDYIRSLYPEYYSKREDGLGYELNVLKEARKQNG